MPVYSQTMCYRNVAKKNLPGSQLRLLASYLNSEPSPRLFCLNLNGQFSLVETIRLKVWGRPLCWHAKYSVPVFVCGSKESLTQLEPSVITNNFPSAGEIARTKCDWVWFCFSLVGKLA